ncbi:MAG: biotin/lipoate A/B protein ligase family protein [SAR324 cluster bacterium]|nr:biotin/lipoate A/B protein ligase family protein [SAR324 cluster bacterium]
MTWRLLQEDGVADSYGLAADEAMTLRIGQGESPTCLRLYTYRSHCALVGRFQRIENELNLGFCGEQDIAVNRRPTGGGAILMGSGQLGVAWMLREQDGITAPRELMRQFAAALSSGLQAFGIPAQFRGKNDLEVDGRKIAGLGIHHNASGGFLFHASLLVDLDVRLMLRALNIPLEKLDDKQTQSIEGRITSVCKESQRDLSVSEVREAVADAFAQHFGTELAHSGFSDEERQAIGELEVQKYLSADWIHQKVEVPDLMGEAKLKTPAGLLDVRVTLAGRQLKAVFLGGDFFASESAIADLEGRLRWHSSDPLQVRNTLADAYVRWADELEFLPLDSLCEVIGHAVNAATAQSSETGTHRYGCFVNPAPSHARTPAV